MIRMLSRVLVGLSLVSSLSACMNSDDLPIQTLSLRDNLPSLEQEAVGWRVDAYLVDAKIGLLSADSSRSAISAIFYSPSEDSESLLVFLEQDGSIVTERVPHSVPVRQTEPILSEYWKLDAEEALDIALSDEGREFLRQNPDSQCSWITLYRNFQRPGEPVEWSLSLSGCLLDGLFQRTTVDPITGQVLSRQSFP